ncbi:MAG: hypothetical protein JW990_18165 [Thermoleophilia bacterium]|nr:hypothetical protein [Thermoleophilia bacterium]
MAKLSAYASKAVAAWKEVAGATGQSASIMLAGDARLVGLAQQQFSDGGTLPGSWVRPLAELSSFSSVPGEVLVVFVSPAEEAEAVAALSQSVPKGKAVVAVDEGPEATGKTAYPVRRCIRLSFSDTPGGWAGLFHVCAEAAGDHVAALGRRYPAMRAAAAERVISRTAGQNALIGLAFFVPGADMPAMTLNQAKMALSLAGIYDQALDRERALELAGVVALGFGSRAVARSLVRWVPGISWVVKAGAGYAATLAIGKGAIRYFEKGAPASTSRVVGLVDSLRR